MSLKFPSVSLSTHKLKFTALALGVLMISSATAWGWFTSRAGDSPPIVVPSSDLPVQPNAHVALSKSEVESEVITLSSTGFTPSEISRPRGRFVIMVDNRTEIEEVILHLNRDDGQRLREAKRTKEELIWKQLEDLPPGEYRLTVLDHPEWVCRITIKPH